MSDAKQIFSLTFIKMLDSYSIDEITITRLCEESNFSRETFYYHFKDKYDLVEWTYIYQVEYFFNNYFGKEPFEDIVSRTLHNMKKINVFYTSGFKDTSWNNLQQSMVSHTTGLFENLTKQINPHHHLSIETKLTIEYNVYGCVFLTKKWLQLEINFTEQELAKLIVKLMSDDLKQLLIENDPYIMATE